MAIKCKVFEPLTAEHFQEAVEELYTDIGNVQYVFPMYLGDFIYSGIAIYDDGTEATSNDKGRTTKEDRRINTKKTSD